MVIGLLSVAAIPTITGVGQAVSAQKRQNASSKEQEKFNLTAKIKGDNDARDEEAVCFLKDGKVPYHMAIATRLAWLAPG